MAAEKGQNRDRPPLDEISPGLRDAVERILRDPVPADLTRRALEGVRDRVPRVRRRYGRRTLLWAVLATAASIGLIALGLQFRGDRALDDQVVKSPDLREIPGELPAARADDLPTAWAYHQAARQSPEALDALLDRHARQSLAADPQPFQAGASFRLLRQML